MEEQKNHLSIPVTSIKNIVGWVLIILAVIFFAFTLDSAFNPSDGDAYGGISSIIVDVFFVVIFLFPGLLLLFKGDGHVKRAVLWSLLSTAILIIVFIIIASFGTFNQFVYFTENANQQLSNIKVIYQKRAEQIPALLEAAREPLQQELEIQKTLAESRANISKANNYEDVIKSANSFDSALSRLLIVVEQYPQLREVESYKYLQTQITATNDQLVSERKTYNDQVKTYNLSVNTFPSSIFAKWFNYTAKPYWNE